jgi:hypothetical protein
MMTKLNNKIVNQILKKKNDKEKASVKITRQEKPEVEVRGKYNFQDNNDIESLENDSDNNSSNSHLESLNNIIIKKEQIEVIDNNRMKKKENVTSEVLIDEQDKNKLGTSEKLKQGYTSLLINNKEKKCQIDKDLFSTKNLSNLIKNNNENNTQTEFNEENLINFKFSRNDNDFIPDEFIFYKKEFSDIASDFSINKSTFPEINQNNKEILKIKNNDFSELLIKEEHELTVEKIKNNVSPLNNFENLDFIKKSSSNKNKEIKSEDNNEDIITKHKNSLISLTTEYQAFASIIDKEKKPDFCIKDSSNNYSEYQSKQSHLHRQQQETYINNNNKIIFSPDKDKLQSNKNKKDFKEIHTKEKEGNDIYLNKINDKHDTEIAKTKLSKNRKNKNEENDFLLYEEERPSDLVVKRSKEQKIDLENCGKESNMKKEKIINNNKEKVCSDNLIKKNSKSISSSNIKYKKEKENLNMNKNKVNISKEKSFSPKSRIIREEDRINTFNRLIQDANRRIEANNELERIKSQLNIKYESNLHKKYNSNDWETIYTKRFQNFINQKNFKIENKIEENKLKEKENEMKIIEDIESRKRTAPMYKIEQSSKRLYNEAEKQKLKKEKNIQKYDDYINTVLTTCRSPQNKLINGFKSPRNQKESQNAFKDTLSKVKSEKNLVLIKSKSNSHFYEDQVKCDKSYTNKNFIKPNKTSNNCFFPSNMNSNIKKKKTLNNLKRNHNNIGVSISSPKENKNSFTSSPYMSNQDFHTRNSPNVNIKLNDFHSVKSVNTIKNKKNIFIPASKIDKYLDTIMNNIK